MPSNPSPVDFPEVQAAVYGVALDLDGFLLNGIMYGVLHPWSEGFVQHAAGSLPTALASLEEQARQVSDADEAEVARLLASLRETSQRLVDLVTGLTSFRTLPLEELREKVRQVPMLRADCVRLIRRLEECLRTPKPFYESRPQDSTRAVDGFLADLEGAFVREWEAAEAERRARSAPTSAPVV
jgi:hypothetical protein